VVIDMVDQVEMLSYARVAEWIDKEVYAESHASLVLIQTLVPFFLFVSLVLQAQAFPGVVVDHWKIPPPSPHFRTPPLTLDVSERSLTPAEGPANTEDGELQRSLSSLPAEPPPPPVLGHLAPVHTDGPPFESLMPPLELGAAADAPTQYQPTISAASGSHNHLQLPVLS